MNADPQTLRAQRDGKRRKSSRIGTVIRKLLGRKPSKAHVSLSTSVSHLDDASHRLTNSTADLREQRVVSLPAQHVTRSSALGSNPPFTGALKEHEPFREQATGKSRRPINRRASLPGAVYAQLKRDGTPNLAEQRAQQSTDTTADIGYAVTSGGHPKRRSKSADALYALAKQALTSPDEAEQERRRSDEIRFWRNSLAPGPTIYGSEPDTEAQPGPAREFRLQQALSAFSDSQTAGSVLSEGLPVAPQPQDNHQSYDFNLIATRLNEQEDIPLDERMMIIEIKLMDLENAIAKGRSRSPPSVATATPRPGQVGTAADETTNPETPNSKISQATQSHSKSAPDSGSTGPRTLSTQPTTSSISVDAAGIAEQDPFVESKLRPLSTSTALHKPLGGGNESPERRQSRAPRPVSPTSTTIDHYATLISLIRREQHARIRLETQVAEMQRELFHLLHPQQQQSSSPLSNVSNSGGSLYRQRRWDGSRRDVVKIDDFHVSKRSKSYEGPEEEASAGGTVTSDDDDYPEVFETPTEAKRMEFEGRFWGRREGEAF